VIMLDTSFLVALARERDGKHARAKEILSHVKEGMLISEFVFAEFVNYLSAKDGGESAHAAAEGLLSSDAEFIFSNFDEVRDSLEILRKYSGFSFTDASCVAIMKRGGISKIASFDSDFDKLKEIERVY